MRHERADDHEGTRPPAGPRSRPGISAVEQFVTRADGSFRVARDVGPSGNSTMDHDEASFGGDARYGASTSEKVHVPC